jgi:DNA polymerase-3 subunit gamma/tau
LALIKLCYLGQALQLAGGEAGKKKQVDSMRPVSFRNIPAMTMVSAGPSAGSTAGAKRLPEQETGGGARLLIETKEVLPEKGERSVGTEFAQPDKVEMVEAGPAPKGGTATLGSLSKIRKQFTDRQQTDDAGNRKTLEPEALQKAWAEYVRILRDNKNPAVQSLELAVLRIRDARSFEAVTSNPLEQKFIEHEKRTLSDHLQKAFADKTLSFTVIIEERTDTEEPTDRPLNKREQFLQIVEQYPLVKELKDRLKLELDY